MKNILLDLDGTISDPKEGITKSIQYALERLNCPIPEVNELLWCIGPPLLDSFKTLLGTDDAKLAAKALSLYRERFGRFGKFENRVYADIPEVLARLNDAGRHLFLATAKPFVFAEEIIQHFKLRPYFEHIYGSYLNGKHSHKADLIEHIVRKEKLQKNETVMVGDRKFDILGAKACHIKSVGVTYGYGSSREIQAAKPDFMVKNPLELCDLFCAP